MMNKTTLLQTSRNVTLGVSGILSVLLGVGALHNYLTMRYKIGVLVHDPEALRWGLLLTATGSGMLFRWRIAALVLSVYAVVYGLRTCLFDTDLPPALFLLFLLPSLVTAYSWPCLRWRPSWR